MYIRSFNHWKNYDQIHQKLNCPNIQQETDDTLTERSSSRELTSPSINQARVALNNAQIKTHEPPRQGK